MTADEVIAALRDACNAMLGELESEYLNGVKNGYWPTIKPILEMGQAALDLARQYRGWRSLEEEKPAWGQDVLCLIPLLGVKVGTYNNGLFFVTNHGWLVADAWHPLPEPPKP